MYIIDFDFTNFKDFVITGGIDIVLSENNKPRIALGSKRIHLYKSLELEIIPKYLSVRDKLKHLIDVNAKIADSSLNDSLEKMNLLDIENFNAKVFYGSHYLASNNCNYLSVENTMRPNLIARFSYDRKVGVGYKIGRIENRNPIVTLRKIRGFAEDDPEVFKIVKIMGLLNFKYNDELYFDVMPKKNETYQRVSLKWDGVYLEVKVLNINSYSEEEFEDVYFNRILVNGMVSSAKSDYDEIISTIEQLYQQYKYID